MVLVSRSSWLSVCVVARDNHCELHDCAKREGGDDVSRKRSATTGRLTFDKDESNEINHGNGCNLYVECFSSNKKKTMEHYIMILLNFYVYFACLHWSF